MGKDTYCAVGVFVQFPFSRNRFRQLIAAGIEHFYVYTCQGGDEAFEFSNEEELVDLLHKQLERLELIPADEDFRQNINIHCFIPCIKSRAHNLCQRNGEPIIFSYNGQETVESVLENFRKAKEKFRSLGFSEESIMVGNNFVYDY